MKMEKNIEDDGSGGGGEDHDDFNNNHLVSKHLAENKEVRLAELFDLLSAEIKSKWKFQQLEMSSKLSQWSLSYERVTCEHQGLATSPSSFPENIEMTFDPFWILKKILAKWLDCWHCW